MRLKPFDVICVAAAIALTASAAAAVYGGGGGKTALVSIKGAAGEWLYRLDAEETISIKGPIGETIAAVSGGKARIVSSPCPNQICVSSGAVHNPGASLSCLPNRVIITIRSTSQDTDALSW